MRFRFRLIQLTGLIVAAAACSALLAAIDRARTAACEAQCRADAQQLFLCLEHHVRLTGQVPPAVVVDALGRPIHSWRTVVWDSARFWHGSQTYDFAQPWHTLANRSLAEPSARSFLCQNTQHEGRPLFTNFGAIVDGDECSLELCKPGSFVGSWAVVIEVPDSKFQWDEPGDVSPSEIANYPTPRDPGGFVVVMSDGRVRRLSREEILENWSRAKAALRAAKSPGG